MNYEVAPQVVYSLRCEFLGVLHVYPVDFVILDIKENEKRPFILGTPFLTTAKATIRFDKGTITLRSGKSKVSFHRIPDPFCMTNKGVKNDIERIAPTMTVNRLCLEWEEKIKIHLEKEMKFNQWRSKSFKGKRPALMETKKERDNEGEVTARRHHVLSLARIDKRNDTLASYKHTREEKFALKPLDPMIGIKGRDEIKAWRSMLRDLEASLSAINSKLPHTQGE
ncbi:reverse transcriptase domain-containing protein [Tanacetum coccineum]